MTNCLTFAWRIWRYSRKDNYMSIRISHHGKLPHFVVDFELRDGTLIRREFVPVKPVKYKFLPPFSFAGMEVVTVYRRESVEVLIA